MTRSLMTILGHRFTKYTALFFLKYHSIYKKICFLNKKVGDPYRWLEDVHSSKVKDFIDAQNKFTDSYLKSDESGGDNVKSKVRERIKARLTDLWMYCDYECPFKRGDRYFYLKNGQVMKNINKKCHLYFLHTNLK